MTIVDGREQSGSTLVTVRGTNLDAAVAPLLRLAAARGLGIGPTLIVDLTTVEFADTSGIGVLCVLSREAGPGAMALVGVSFRLRQILARIPPQRLPAIYDSVDDALIAFDSLEPSRALSLTFVRMLNDTLLTSDYASHA